MGCFPVELKAGRDTAVGLPLERSSVFVGRIESVAGETIRLAGEFTWETNCWAGASGEFFYLQVVTGDLIGARFPILANEGRSILVSSEGEDLRQLTHSETGLSGESVRILPYWTPSTVFQSSGIEPGTSIILFDRDYPDAEGSWSSQLRYAGEGVWLTESGEPASHYPLRSDRGFFVRLEAGGVNGSIRLVGCVPMLPERQVLNDVAAGRGGEVLFALNHPESISLRDAGFAFADRTEVYCYENARRFDQNPCSVYTYYEGYGWFDQAFRPMPEDACLEAGQAYFVRIPRQKEALCWVWKREPAYLSVL